MHKDVYSALSVLSAFAAILIILYWGRRALHKVLQKGVHRSILGFVIVMVGWQLSIVLQVLADGVAPDLQRWLWYSQYMFRNLMSLCIVIMASATGKAVNKDYMTGWEKLLCVFHFALDIFILGNDFHRQFIYDINNYSYDNIHNNFGWAYYFLFTMEYVELVVAIGWMILKAQKDKIFNRRMLAPVIVVAVLILYRSLFVLGYTSFAAAQPGLIYLLGSILLVDTCMWSGLLSANTRYAEFFEVSNLGLEIYDEKGNRAYSSINVKNAEQDDYEVLKRKIKNGTVCWYKDTRVLKKKQNKLEQTLMAQELAYKMCKEQELVQEQVVDYELRSNLYKELDQIMVCKKPLINKYLNLLQKPTQLAAAASSINRLNILVCYLKKRCVLFLTSLTSKSMEAGNLFMAMSESKKYMAYEELDYLLQFELKGNLPMNKGLLLYDFHEEFLEGYIINGGVQVVSRVYETASAYELSFIVDEFEPWMEPWIEHVKLYLSLDQEICTKDLGYAFTLTLSLPKEEVSA